MHQVQQRECKPISVSGGGAEQRSDFMIKHCEPSCTMSRW